MGLLLSCLRPTRPKPAGRWPLGSIRERLAFGGEVAGRSDILVQVHYPAIEEAPPRRLLQSPSFPFFRDEVLQELSSGYGLPLWLLRGLLGSRRQLDMPLAPAEPPGRPESGAGWPIAIFSSGIWGCCEMYTQFLRDLASSGMIVIAVEHEDGSGIFAVSSGTGQPIPYVTPPTDVDTVTFRQPFLEIRTVELAATTAATLRLASSKDTKGTSVPMLQVPKTALAEVLQHGDAGNLMLVGHSFGSAGILRHLRLLAESRQPCPYRGALLLDTWTASLLEVDKAFVPEVPVAMLLSQSWLQSPLFPQGNQRIISNLGKQCLAAAAVTGTSHQWISESHLMGPAWILRRFGLMGPGNYARCYGATVRAALVLLEALRGGGGGPPSARSEVEERLRGVGEELTLISGP